MTRRHKLEYPIGQGYTLGKPTQGRTGLGRFVTLMEVTEDGKVIVEDTKGKTATVKFCNLGSIVDLDGNILDMTKYAPRKKNRQP